MADEENALNKALMARGLPTEIIGKQLIFSGFYYTETGEQIPLEVRVVCGLVSYSRRQLFLCGESCKFTWDERGRVWHFFSQLNNYMETLPWGNITVI